MGKFFRHLMRTLGNERGEVVNNEPPAGGGDYKPPELNMAEAIPPEFRDKPYFKDKTFVDVVKEHVNLQTLLGQRPAGIPKEDASDEEWGKFIGAIKPKDAAEYVLPETDFSKVNKRTPEYEKAVREIMFEAGIPKRQFPKVIGRIEAFLQDGVKVQSEKAKQEAEARDKEFEGLLDSTWKDQKQTVLDRTKKLMVESVAPELREKVDGVLKNLSNDALFALTAVLNGVYEKHIKEDAPPGGGDNTAGDSASWQREAETIMRSPEYNDFRSAGHEEARSKVQELFKKIAAARK